MESNWRRNIPELGLVGYGYTMAARLLSGGEGYDYVGQRVSGSDTYNLFSIGFLDDLQIVTFTIRPALGQNFPYGRDVEPD